MINIEIQDNIRENEIIKIFKLKKTNVNRIGIDARLKLNGKIFDFEIKSTTIGNVSTASPLSLDHIKKWRTQHWLIGIYKKDATLDHCVYGSPQRMKDWLDYWESDIKRGLSISDMLVDKIDMNMVYKIFGKKKKYTISEVRKITKNLYSKEIYESLLNEDGYYSSKTVLDIFKDHNKVYLYRGSSLNNPKIPKQYYKNWPKIYQNYDKELRKILKESVL